MQLDISSLLLGTLDPARVQDATQTIQELKKSPDFADLLYAHMLDSGNSEQTRYLAAIYFAQIFRNPLSHEQNVLLQFAQSALHSFCTLPTRIRRVIKDSLAATLCHLYRCGKLQNLYNDYVTIVQGVLRNSNVDLSYQGPLSVELLLMLSDLISIVLPFLTHATTVELDDALTLKLQNIIKSTSEMMIPMLCLAGACHTSSVVDQTSFISYQHFLNALYSFFLSMYSLDDLPTVYQQHYLKIATTSMEFLDISTLISRGFDMSDPVVGDVRKRIVDMLCNSISMHSSDLAEYAPNVIKLLIDMACSYVVTADNKTSDFILTDVLFHLQLFADSLEMQKYVYSNSVQLMDKVVFAALRLTQADFAAIETEDPQYIYGLLSTGDATSRRSACEGILRAICRGFSESRVVAMQKAQESIAALSQGVGTLAWFVSLCQSLVFYRSVVIQQISGVRGVMRILPDSNFDEFYAAVVTPSLGIPYVCNNSDAPELAAARVLTLCEVMRFITDFRNIMSEEQLASGLQIMLRSIDCRHSTVSNVVLASYVSTIIRNCEHTAVLERLGPQFTNLLFVFLPIDANTSSDCLLFHSGSNDVHVAHAFSSILKLVRKSLQVDTILKMALLFLKFIFPTCLQQKERLKFVHKLFDALVILLNTLIEQATDGTKIGVPALNEVTAAYADLYPLIEAEEDWIPIYLQVQTPLMQLAALVGTFSEETYPVLLQKMVPMYISATTQPFTAVTPACALVLNALVSLASVHNKTLLGRSLVTENGESTTYIAQIVRFGVNLVASSNFKRFGCGLLTGIAASVPECIIPGTYEAVLNIVQKDITEVQSDRKILGAVCLFFAQYACSCDQSSINSPFIVEQLLIPFSQKVFLKDTVVRDIAILLTKLPVGQLDESIKWDVLRCLSIFGGLIRKRVEFGSRQRASNDQPAKEDSRAVTDGGALFNELIEVQGTWPCISVPDGFNLTKHITDAVPFDFKSLSV